MQHVSKGNQYRALRTGVILNNFVLFVEILARLFGTHCYIVTLDLDFRIEKCSSQGNCPLELYMQVNDQIRQSFFSKTNHCLHYKVWQTINILKQTSVGQYISYGINTGTLTELSEGS